MDRAKHLQLSGSRSCLLHVYRVVEIVHQIVADLAQLRDLDRDSSSPGWLGVCLRKARVGIWYPLRGFLVREDLCLWRCHDAHGQLRKSSEIVGPALVEQKAAPESDAPDILFSLTTVGVLSSAQLASVEVQSHIAGHPERHAAVYPTSSLSRTAGFSHRHQSECLHCRQSGYFMEVTLQYQPLGLFEEVIACSRRVIWLLSCTLATCEVAAERKHSIDEKRSAVVSLSFRVG